MTAINDIAAERKRQIDVEGWAAEHDDKHDAGELATAAACYALASSGSQSFRRTVIERFWPWDRDWWKPKDKRRNLVKAAALIVAEIERLDRHATGSAGGDTMTTPTPSHVATLEGIRKDGSLDPREAGDGWNYWPTVPVPEGDARKIVTLVEDGMTWVGIRAFNFSARKWMSNNEPERATVHAWRDLPAPARGFWSHGKFYLTERTP